MMVVSVLSLGTGRLFGSRYNGSRPNCARPDGERSTPSIPALVQIHAQQQAGRRTARRLRAHPRRQPREHAGGAYLLTDVNSIVKERAQYCAIYPYILVSYPNCVVSRILRATRRTLVDSVCRITCVRCCNGRRSRCSAGECATWLLTSYFK